MLAVRGEDCVGNCRVVRQPHRKSMRSMTTFLRCMWHTVVDRLSVFVKVAGYTTSVNKTKIWLRGYGWMEEKIVKYMLSPHISGHFWEVSIFMHNFNKRHSSESVLRKRLELSGWIEAIGWYRWLLSVGGKRCDFVPNLFQPITKRLLLNTKPATKKNRRW